MNIGDKVYIYSLSEDRLIEGVVSSEFSDRYHITYFWVVNMQGDHIRNINGGSIVKKEDAWKTVEEAVNIVNARKKEAVRKYESSITDVKDLLKFPLEHNFNKEDYEAVMAYKIRSKELLGIVKTY